MRIGGRYEHLLLVSVLLVSTFFFADEEPVLDLSDLNLLHVWVLVGCVAATYFDLTLRARYGQFLTKDQTSLVAAFTFSWGLENYIRALLFVFCLHNLMPLELDLVEQVSLYQAWGAWLGREVLPGGCVLLLLLGLAYNLNGSVGFGGGLFILCNLVLLCLGHVLVIGLLAWDLVTAGFSSLASGEEASVFYMQPKTALTLDRALGVGDQFEWHRERTGPYSLRFEDLYFFFFQLLMVWDLLCSLFFWCCVTVSSLRLGGRAVSYTQVGIGLTLLEHVAAALVVFSLSLFAVGLRVGFSTPGEFGGFWW